MSKHDKLIKLIQENPDLEIIPYVDCEVVGEDFGSWIGKWGYCYIDMIYKCEDRHYKRSTQFEDLVEDIVYEKYCKWEDKNIDVDEMEELATNIANSYKWVKCILVDIESL